MFLLRKCPEGRSRQDNDLNWDDHDHQIQRSFALLAQLSPVWLHIHADIRPLTAPALEGVDGIRGIDAIEEGCADEGCDEADCGGGE
jgi:hypothetical protein